jgi:hypothetical protein
MSELAIEENKEKEETLSQMDWFEKVNLNEKKLNRYPKTQLEEALNFDERFAEHLANKKREQIERNRQELDE